jgi:hypothetical protein
MLLTKTRLCQKIIAKFSNVEFHEKQSIGPSNFTRRHKDRKISSGEVNCRFLFEMSMLSKTFVLSRLEVVQPAIF